MTWKYKLTVMVRKRPATGVPYQKTFSFASETRLDTPESMKDEWWRLFGEVWESFYFLSCEDVTGEER